MIEERYSLTRVFQGDLQWHVELIIVSLSGAIRKIPVIH